MGKGEIARQDQFLLFPQCFLFIQIIVSHLSIFLTSYLYLLLDLKSLKLVYKAKVNCVVFASLLHSKMRKSSRIRLRIFIRRVQNEWRLRIAEKQDLTLWLLRAAQGPFMKCKSMYIGLKVSFINPFPHNETF